MGDDFLREARAGRVIVTNVRGVSRERTLEEFPDLPETFDVIHVDDKTAEGRDKWAKWFHWMPHGAFIFVDEVQDIWPKSWRDANLRTLDYPGGVDAATKDDRPKDWEQALDKHRHYNWDMTLTTPSYAKVRDDVKGIADMAYKHKNLALIGWKGRYIEGAHAADDSGKAASDFINVQKKKVPPYVFKLYDSTQTGVVSDTKSGFNIFTNPRVMVLLGVLALVVAFVSTKSVPKVLGGSGSPNSILSQGAAPVDRPASSGAAGAVPPGADRSGGFSTDVRLEPFVEGDPVIIISYQIGAKWKYTVRHNQQDFTTSDLLDLGYAVQSKGSCGLVLVKDGFKRVITCGQGGDKKEAVQGVASSPPVVPIPSNA